MVYPYPVGSSSINRELEDFAKENESLFQQWWVQADNDTKLATGQQDYYNNAYGFNAYRNQKLLQFNKILRILNMIGGFQRDNRLASVITAGDNDPDLGETADQRTTVLDWVMQKDSTYEKISDCFDGSNTVGLNLLNLWMDFREDPESGDIRSDRLPFSSFLMDSYWTKQDLSDCGRIWTRRYLTAKQLTSLIPGIKNDLPALGKGYSSRDGKFQFMAQNWYQYQQQIYAYDEYWTKDYKTKRKLLDKATGEVADWNGTKEQFQLLKRFNPNVDLIKAQVPTIKLHVLVNNHLIYEEQSPYGIDRFPFAVSLCYHYPEVQDYAYRYFGVVRNIRDSQVELNRRRNRLLDCLDAQIQSGLMLKEDALVNPEDAFFQGPGKILFFKQTANLVTDQVVIPTPSLGGGWLELIESVEKEIMDIVGPEELFAQNMGAKEMTGVLMKLKMGAGLTGLRNIFDRLNVFQKNASEIIDDMIVANFTPGKVAHILGKSPSELFFSKEYSKFNCVVEEGVLTSTQRQMKFLEAMQFKQLVPEAIDGDYLLELSSLQDKKKLAQKAQARQEQMAQAQQAQLQSQLQQSQMLSRSLEAKAEHDFAAAEMSQATAVQKIALAKQEASEAVHQRASAALENVRALHELQGMDEDRLMKLARYIIELQQGQAIASGDEEADSAEKAQAISSEVKQSEMASRP